MTGTGIPLLLADPSPGLRLLVLRHLLGRSEDDAEVIELNDIQQDDPLVLQLLEGQTDTGYWPAHDFPGRKSALRGTIQALIRLGTLGFGPDYPAVHRGADFLFSQQMPDGSWPLESDLEQKDRYSNYDMIPLQTAMPLRALATCGFATDPRAERAYKWLLTKCLDDGAWPTGKASGTYGRVAGYRRLPHSRWGCRSNTTGVLLCLAYHPQRRSSPEAQRALDHLLSRESREQQAFGFEIARIIGVEKARGLFTYFAHFDLALILDLCWRAGASLADPRVASLVNFVLSLRGPYGLWNYHAQPGVDRWLTYYLLRSLSSLDQGNEWISLEPSTPFQPYPHKDPRY